MVIRFIYIVVKVKDFVVKRQISDIKNTSLINSHPIKNQYFNPNLINKGIMNAEDFGTGPTNEWPIPDK